MVVGISKKVGGDKDTKTRWRDDNEMREKSQTCGYRKIPLSLLPMLQHSCRLVSKTGRCEVAFLVDKERSILCSPTPMVAGKFGKPF